MPIMLEKSRDNTLEYDAVFVEPKHLAALNNPIAVSIVKELSLQPGCAMDLARKLNQHEQKIYYHLNKLARGQIVKIVGTERRYGMVAQMFGLTSSVVAAKLNDHSGKKVTGKMLGNVSRMDPKIASMLDPFVKDGKLNAMIIVGNTQPHGRYNEGSREGPYAMDLTMFLGNMVDEIKAPCYRFDTQVKDQDLLNNNLILIGNPRTNVIVDRVNENLPLYFEATEGNIVNRANGKKYTQDAAGIIVKMDNPFNPSKKILVIAGKRTRGARAAILALTQHLDKFASSTQDPEKISAVVMGYDKDADYEIDDVEVLEG